MVEMEQTSKKRLVTSLILCISLGYLGVHKFYQKKYGLGVLYLCTLGLFYVGWIVDCVKLASALRAVNKAASAPALQSASNAEAEHTKEETVQKAPPQPSRNGQNSNHAAKGQGFMLPPEYIVFDLETTGFDRLNDRIIEIAAIRYSSGAPAAVFHSFVNPQVAIPRTVTRLTGITQEMVCSTPAIEQLRDDFLTFVADLPIVGHNVSGFDVPFISAQMQISLSNELIDTLKLSRLAFPDLESHRLEYLKETLNLSNGGSHRATDDVETTNALLLACVEKGIPLRSRASSTTKKYSHKTTSKDLQPRTDHLDPNHPFYGKNIVFTGDLSIPRREAAQLAVDFGAIVKSSVSSKTNYLVVGIQDPAAVGEKGTSSKEDAAMLLNDAGKASIQFLSEREFLNLVAKAVV